MKLNALAIKNIEKPGRYADGGGLYLLVKPSGSRTWVFRYSFGKERRDMGLGPIADLPLTEARKRAADLRRALLDGKDPIAIRQLERAEGRQATFGDVLEDFIQTQQAKWKTDKQAADIRASFRNHAPQFLELPVRAITFDHIVSVLEPLWGVKTETATRIQARMEAVLGLAKVRGLRTGDNPAVWKGNLSFKFPRRLDVQPVENFEAMARDELPAFYARLKAKSHVSYLALRFIILTVGRTRQALFTPWNEIDFEAKVWDVPPERMKRPRAHRTPLSRQALELLSELRDQAENEWVFPSTQYGKHLSQMACLEVMRELKRTETVHGFRSTFKDWQRAFFPHLDDAGEMALSHVIGDKTKAAYARDDLLEQRRPLMQAWADFVDPPST